MNNVFTFHLTFPLRLCVHCPPLLKKNLNEKTDTKIFVSGDISEPASNRQSDSYFYARRNALLMGKHSYRRSNLNVVPPTSGLKPAQNNFGFGIYFLGTKYIEQSSWDVWRSKKKGRMCLRVLRSSPLSIIPLVLHSHFLS
jgi:hypothetical protein